MNKNLSAAVAGAATAVFLFILQIATSLPMDAAPKQKGIALPDFAYPETSARNASESLTRAISRNQWPEAIKALTEKVTAENLISASDMAPRIAEIDSVCGIAPDSWKPAIRLMKGNFLAAIYQNNRRRADDRTLPLDSIPENPAEWSKDIFAMQIADICSGVLADEYNKGKLLKEWGAFLKDTAFAFECDMTIEEFEASQCSRLAAIFATEEMTDVIPFFMTQSAPATPVGKCGELRKLADSRLSELALRNQQNILRAYALMQEVNTLPYSKQAPDAFNAYNELKGTEGEQIILIELNRYLQSNKVRSGNDAQPFITSEEYVEALRSSIATFPKGRYSNGVRNMLHELTAPSARVNYKQQYLSSEAITMQAVLSNCNESWILIYDYSLYAGANNPPTTKQVANNCKLIKAVKITAGGSIPFSEKTEAEVGKLNPGTYVAIPSATASKSGIYADVASGRWREPFIVSDISVLTLRCPDNTTKVFVVSAANGKPIEGAKVEVYSYPKNYGPDKTLTATLTTDRDGCVSVTEKRFDLKASYGGSKWSSDNRYSNYNTQRESSASTRAEILSDRSIYHPGDSLEAVAVAYTATGTEMSLNIASAITLRLLDANRKVRAEQECVTDEFGRAACSFLIPDDGLLGLWRVEASDAEKVIGHCNVSVADYVAPTFFVTADNSHSEPELGSIVSITGDVLTYSGMPVAGAKVEYQVHYSSPMRWWFGGYATFNGSVVADASGKYEIQLPTSNLKGTAFEKGVFDVRISATSLAGETHEGPLLKFALGKEFSVSAEFDQTALEVDGEDAIVKFYVWNMLGKKVNKDLEYSIIDLKDNKKVAEGIFSAPNLNLPADSMPSATYLIKVNLAGNKDVSAETKLILWRKSDTCAPAGTGLWTPEKIIYASVGENIVNVTIGSGNSDRWIPAVISSDNKIIATKWLHIEHDNILLPIDAPKGNETLQLNLTYVSDLKFDDSSVTIKSAESADVLEVKTESFRDRLTAGDREKWTFRFGKKYTPAGVIPAMAVMTDKALNAIAPFSWSFSPNPAYRPSFFGIQHPYDRQQSVTARIKSYKYLNYNSITLPLLQDYDRDWGLARYEILRSVMLTSGAINIGAVVNEVKMMKAAQGSARASAKVEGMADYAVEYAEDAAPMYAGALEEAEVQLESDAALSEAADSSELRDSEYPVAFFMPYLTSDEEGLLNIEFTTPNFNTTWAFQLIGYDRKLQATKIALEAMATKPVMVTTNAPRFVRTGDRIWITATAFNNSGAEESVSGRLELIDLLSGKLIAAKDFDKETIKDSASRLMTMEWPVADGYSSVGFRAYAMCGNHKDGEQAIVPVLPASTPVVESTPFWIEPSGKEISVKLPKFKPTDRITLQYCDNPAWYCLTALPAIVSPDTKSVIAKSRALFANATAFHLISDNNSLKEGLEALLTDKDSPYAALRSNLEKDGQLKIADLNNTPWVNDAESETLRMSRLSSLLDSEDAKKIIAGIIADLSDSQTASGGWSWCPDMRPSAWITSEVVRYLAMSAHNGALADFPEWENVARKAVSYVDSEMVDEYHKYHKKGESLAYLLDWLYTRSSLPKSVIANGAKSREMNTLASRALSDIAKEWKNFGIADKAKASMILARSGKTKEADAILESLRQFASVSPERGIWFDNLTSGYGNLLTLRTTTLALQAFSEVQPDSKMIDGLRQWMVLGRQYQDWGKSMEIAETVNAILTSGSNWTSASGNGQATIFIGEKKVDTPPAAALTGAFTITIKAGEASKKTLRVLREGTSPAWGGVVSQYVSPIDEVKAADVPDLRIEKRLVALEEQPDGSLRPKEGIELRKGMRVRVTLVLTAGRDLDYVAVTDSRSACLEPSEQLSGISHSDGIWYYKEVRDEATNLYFDTLPKGVHVVNYDCRVSSEGDFSCGIATAQSQYSPSTVAHTSGFVMKSR